MLDLAIVLLLLGQPVQELAEKPHPFPTGSDWHTARWEWGQVVQGCYSEPTGFSVYVKAPPGDWILWYSAPRFDGQDPVWMFDAATLPNGLVWFTATAWNQAGESVNPHGVGSGPPSPCD